jgi:hypothetical protein
LGISLELAAIADRQPSRIELGKGMKITDHTHLRLHLLTKKKCMYAISNDDGC